MGRESVIESFDQDKFADGAEYMTRRMRDIGMQFTTMGNHLHDILGAPDEYTDKDGVHYKVGRLVPLSQHEIAALGDNRPPKDETSLRELFDDPKFRKKPFWEVGRNTESHFRIYCLANGISEDDMLSLGSKNPPADAVERITAMRKPFVEMILKHDTEAMANMYTSLVDRVMSKSDDILSMVDSPENILKNGKNMILFGNVQSYITQTLDLGGKTETQETRDLIGKIDAKLKEKGYSFDFHQFENFLAPLGTLTQTGVRAGRKTDADIAEGKEGIADPIIEDIDVNYFNGLADDIHTFCGTANEAYRPYKEQKEALGSLDKAIAEKPFDPLDYNRYKVDARGVNLEEFYRQISPEQFKKLVVKNPKDLSKEMRDHVRTTLGVERKPSEQYQAVINSLDKVTELRTELAQKDLTPEVRKDREQLLNRQYEDLKTVSWRYLALRNPSSPDGEERYRMVLEAQLLAEKEHKGSFRKIVEPEISEKEQKRNELEKQAKEKYYRDFFTENLAHTEKIHEGEPLKDILYAGMPDRENHFKEKFNKKDGIYLDQPFNELHRHPADHFKVYLISQGITPDMLVRYIKNPDAPENQSLKLQMQEHREEFLAGVENPDKDARVSFAVDMYTNFAKVMSANTASITNKMANGTAQEKAELGGLFMGMEMGPLYQSLNLGVREVNKISPEQIDVAMRVRENLEPLGFDLYNVGAMMDCAENYGKTFDAASTHIERLQASPEERTGFSDLRKGEFYKGVFDQCHRVDSFFKDQYQKNAQSAAAYAPGKAASLNFYAAYPNVSWPETSEHAEARAAELFNPTIGNLTTLRDKIRDNVRPGTLFGTKSNSKEYNDVISKFNRVIEYEQKKLEGSVPANANAANAQEYQDLKASISKYLTKRDPGSPAGKERYGLMILADNMVTAKMTNVPHKEYVAENPIVSQIVRENEEIAQSFESKKPDSGAMDVINERYKARMEAKELDKKLNAPQYKTTDSLKEKVSFRSLLEEDGIADPKQERRSSINGKALTAEEKQNNVKTK